MVKVFTIVGVILFLAGTLIRTEWKSGELHEPQDSIHNATLEPSVEDAIRYVSLAGNDANSGLSWGRAKLTIYGALVSLPGGSGPHSTAGAGTVYFSDGVSANPTANAGIWLMARDDPQYARTPTGWLRTTGGLKIEGVAKIISGPQAHRPRSSILAGGNTDINHPAIWLSQTQIPIEFDNISIAYPGRSIVIGECSNHIRTGKCGVSGVTLINVGEIPYTKTGFGPGIDITGGSFWIFMQDVSAGGNAIDAAGGPSANAAAAILIDGAGNSGNGLIQLQNMNLSAGGIKFIPGSNGGSVYVQNLTEEGDFVHDIPPPVWFTSYDGFVDALLLNIQVADAGPKPTPAVQNDGNVPGPAVAGALGSKGLQIQGPATVLSQYNNALINQRSTPLQQRQVGFFNGYVVGETDIARRLGSPAAVRFANKAVSNPSQWTATNYSGKTKIVLGQSDPFGGNLAAAATSAGDQQESLFLTGSCQSVSYVPHTGDWIVAGAWVRSASGGFSRSTTNAITMTYCGNPKPTYSYSATRTGQIQGDGEWQWQWMALKVSGGEKTTISLAGFYDSTHSLTAFGPVLQILPSGAASDNEVLEYANALASFDSSCPVGSICPMAGHGVVSSTYGTLSNCAAKGNPAECGASAAGSFAVAPEETIIRVETKAVTSNSQILLTQDASIAGKLGVSCSTEPGRSYLVAERIPGSSFKVRVNKASDGRYLCLSFNIIN